MSRIGRKEVTVPSGVAIQASSDEVQVKGPKGQLTFPLFREVAVEMEDGVARVVTTGAGTARRASALQGLVRAHLANMVAGVTQGFREVLGNPRHGLELQSGRSWH